MSGKHSRAVKKREGLAFPDLEGETVKHLRYGEGTITVQDNKYLTVSFEKAGLKKFVLPDALTKGFLTVSSEEALDTCHKIAELDETIQKTQREMELLHIELNGYTE